MWGRWVYGVGEGRGELGGGVGGFLLGNEDSGLNYHDFLPLIHLHFPIYNSPVSKNPIFKSHIPYPNPSPISMSTPIFPLLSRLLCLSPLIPPTYFLSYPTSSTPPPHHLDQGLRHNRTYPLAHRGSLSSRILILNWSARGLTRWWKMFRIMEGGGVYQHPAPTLTIQQRSQRSTPSNPTHLTSPLHSFSIRKSCGESTLLYAC